MEVDEPTGDGVVVDVHAAGVAFPDALLSPAACTSTSRAAVCARRRDRRRGAQRAGRRGVAKGDRVVGLTMLTGGMAEVVALEPEGCSSCRTT